MEVKKGTLPDKHIRIQASITAALEVELRQLAADELALQKDALRLRRENERLQKALAAAEELHKDAESRAASLEQKLLSANQACREASAHVEQLTTTCQQMEQENESMRRQNDDVTKKAHALQVELQQVDVAHEDEVKEMAETQKKSQRLLRDLVKKMERLQMEVPSLKKDLSHEERLHAAAVQALGKLEAEHEDACARLRSATQLNTELRARNRELIASSSRHSDPRKEAPIVATTGKRMPSPGQATPNSSQFNASVSSLQARQRSNSKTLDSLEARLTAVAKERNRAVQLMEAEGSSTPSRRSKRTSAPTSSPPPAEIKKEPRTGAHVHFSNKSRVRTIREPGGTPSDRDRSHANDERGGQLESVSELSSIADGRSSSDHERDTSLLDYLKGDKWDGSD